MNTPRAVSDYVSGANRKMMMMPPMRVLSKEGQDFLKCAFAPPDFAGVDVKGVPDLYLGRSLVKKHRSITQTSFSAQTSSVTNDYYFLLLPTPGVAYWACQKAQGSPLVAADIWYPQYYSDFSSMFGTGGNNKADVVNKFRYVSQHFELVPTVNAMQWSGSISAFKMPVQVAARQSGASTGDLWSVTGIQSVNSTIGDQFTGGFNLGVFVGAFNAGAQFDFTAVLEQVTNIPTTVGSGDFGQLAGTQGGTSYGIPGFDNNMESVCIKISGMGTNVSNTAIIKTWACVEYQVLNTASLYEYQTMSPTDPLALEVYRKVAMQLPVAVSYFDNESFWRRVLDIIRNSSKALSILPGPYGMAAGGVNLLGEAINQLTL